MKDTTKRRLLTTATWVLTLVGAVFMFGAGSGKFMNPEFWGGMFVDWGYPRWFSKTVGVAEMAGAVLLLVPRVAHYAALWLLAIMVAAFINNVVHPNEMGLMAPVSNSVILLGVFLLRRGNQSTSQPGQRGQ